MAKILKFELHALPFLLRFGEPLLCEDEQPRMHSLDLSVNESIILVYSDISAMRLLI